MNSQLDLQDKCVEKRSDSRNKTFTGRESDFSSVMSVDVWTQWLWEQGTISEGRYGALKAARKAELAVPEQLFNDLDIASKIFKHNV